MKNILAKNLLILASAGSGKTFQLGNRVIGLVAGGVEPERIVALTFTRKAAGEFADSVLTKLAKAASDERAAAGLRRELGQVDADFEAALEKVVRALPRFTLGTMDGFFAKVVRGFQYELGLTGGKFNLLEGPRAEAAADEVLAAILGEALEDENGEEFLHAFRRATMGKESQGVIAGLRDFVKLWQGRHRAKRDCEWGPGWLAGVEVDDWEKQKAALLAKAARGLEGHDYTDKRQQDALAKVLVVLEGHSIGSGSLGGAKSLLESILKAAETDGPLRVSYFKEFLIAGPAGEALRDAVLLAGRCEMAAALVRTRAVREVVAVYDALCERDLRRKGLLGFDDLKELMGQWVKSEDARLRREAVDFRLDARYEHWLLDEFQDTSGADWLGLVPLIDEAAGAGDGSVFIVGDRKQAIYAWRGGEVGLFDEVMERYRGDLDIETLVESWRSCPEVLELVNQVCGDLSWLRELFGEAASGWQWQDHFSASPLQEYSKRGEARVEVVDGKWEATLERLGELLNELEVGKRAMTCGVLVRNNTTVREIADDLRARGFDVIEEGQRQPAKDHPVGIVLSHLLKWLADPANAFAWEVVEMSPLAAKLQAKFGGFPAEIWEGLLEQASALGFAGMIEGVVELCWAEWSEFGRRRAGDLLTALASLDAQGVLSVQDAADWVERLAVSQSPGVAAVQVMTIHKSKGLGFDIVILPDVPSAKIPSASHFEVAEGESWISAPPPRWARQLIPAMREAERRWGVGQAYESFCMLYVALTRSKRGLYVLLEPPAKSQAADHPSLANWLAGAVKSDGKTGIVYQAGNSEWITELPLPDAKPGQLDSASLPSAVARHERTTATMRKSTTSAAGQHFGSLVHQALERIEWIDEAAPVFPADDVGKFIRSVLTVPAVISIFERKGRFIELFREQPIQAMADGKIFGGVIDRLHLYTDQAGEIVSIEIIDFKTDTISTMAALASRHAPQMEAYRQVLAQLYPRASIKCMLLSTHHRACLAL